MRVVLLALALAVGFADCAAAQAVARNQRATAELCAPRQFWTSAAARACVIAAHRQGARQGYWSSTNPFATPFPR
jgi:hypothetical protein